MGHQEFYGLGFNFQVNTEQPFEVVTRFHASKVANELELAQLQEDIADTEEIKDSKASDPPEEQALDASLVKDCAWVERHFDSRREKRMAEIEVVEE